MMLTIHFHLVLRLRMSRIMSAPPVCLYLNGGQRGKFTANLQTEKVIKF